MNFGLSDHLRAILALLALAPMSVLIAQSAALSAENQVHSLNDPVTFQLILDKSEIRFGGKVPFVPDFSGRAEQFEGNLGGTLANLEGDGFAQIVIETRSLITGLKWRDRNMVRALEAEDYPQIRFSMIPGNMTYIGKGPAPVVTDFTYRSSVKGVLELHGVKREVTMEVEWSLTGERIYATGATSLLMSDYGIVRPRPPLLPVQVDDEIKVWFSIIAERVSK